ncbi:MAG: hypothetical protein HY231_26890 [Acidobacteria bacterium]|nr:hypothetical protein [Acidobacteriota bacterium]
MNKFRSLAFLFLALALVNAACIKHLTVPEQLAVKPPVSMEELVRRINSFQEIKTFGSQGSIVVRNYFTGEKDKADQLPGANFVIRLMRPENIRLQVKAPVIGNQVADMVSDGKMFRLAIYYPDDKRQFIYGSNLEDLHRMERSDLKDPTLIKAGGLLNMRPQHITDAFLIKPIDGNLEVFREEVLQEEADTRPNKKGKRVNKSYYVLYVIERDQTGDQNGLTHLRRKFWFDRNQAGTPLVRQQTFESNGRLASDIAYGQWFTVPNSTRSFPETITIDRHNDGYRIELSNEKENSEINLELNDTTFRLENTEKLPEKNLDDARKSAPATSAEKKKPEKKR